ncbi:TIM barrel protein [Terrimonas sp. NA20]|uniref:TIM barrel protein n=1 Tax=Terrimonas ginsenosidimutans TaxID=2908004 RepID=A0ABS9KU45_9BACT|nr:TIM barrel protein [Terrimonas ginsenosidimutans]MCG2615862.1 TIM barrel protein [Terrimonas ginsenosidimutans]
MHIYSFCPRWGQSHITWDDFASMVKSSGYDGVETDIPADEKERDIILNALSRHGLQLIAQHWETVEPDFSRHLSAYKERLEIMALANPVLINSQTGKDHYTFEQNALLIEAARELAMATGIPVYHETHRGKFSFAAHITKEYLQRIPDLMLTMDLSHWIAVAETLLHDQQDAVAIAASRSGHFHARVGHTQGAQVNDPRAPEWEESLNVHIDCWDKIYKANKEAGKPFLTFTAEFGPAPYMPLLPFTRQPVANQWEINEYMSGMLKSRYKV